MNPSPATRPANKFAWPPAERSPHRAVFLPLLLLPLLLLVAACSNARPAPPAAEPPTHSFPLPDRPVASIVSSSWSDEASRDDAREAETVFRLLQIRPGMAIADIGAGSGYYVPRLAQAVGPTGKVFAQDIIPDYLASLQRRIVREKLANAVAILGTPGNAMLPRASTDLALMVHMYHEIEKPYELLWHLHESLKPGATLAIIDTVRETQDHGTPPALLECELKAAGYRQTARHTLPDQSYLATFTPTKRPAPGEIKPCRLK